MSDDDVIYAYTREQAVEDGVLVDIGCIGQDTGNGRVQVCVTNNAFHACDLQNPMVRGRVVAQALNELSKDDPEDTDYMRLRVLPEKCQGNTLWAVHDGDGITIMKPEDY